MNKRLYALYANVNGATKISLTIAISPAALFKLTFCHFFTSFNNFSLFLFNIFFYFYIRHTRIPLNHNMSKSIWKISLMRSKLFHVAQLLIHLHKYNYRNEYVK